MGHACQHCGREFSREGRRPSAYHHKPPTFCSRRCVGAAKRERGRQIRVKRVAEAERRKAERETLLAAIVCAECGKTGWAGGPHAKRCRPCGILYHSKRASKADKSRRPCGECGRSFTPKYGTRRRRFCSEFCQRRHTKRVGKAKRRAVERGAEAEAIDPMRVFRRDGWRCQICGERTPRRLRGTLEPRAPELDHIIPLGAGGAHAWSNVQLACRECNEAKGARPLGQMRLA